MPRHPRSSATSFFYLILVLLVAGLIYILFLQPAPTARAPGQIPDYAKLQPSRYGDRYYYAGMPRPLPAFPYQITVLTNTGYVVGYCEARKDPAWVCYRLVKVPNLKAPPRPRGFEVDLRTLARVSQQDYTGSGFDRGHMAPNYAIAVCFGQQAQQETFEMSNIIPQAPHLNRDVWERLEQEEIKVYAQRYSQMWVIDGPVFGAKPRRLRSGVAVPSACYKILVAEENGEPRMLAFVMPQDVQGTESPDQFLTSVEEIQRETGLDFFGELPLDLQMRLEADRAGRMW